MREGLPQGQGSAAPLLPPIEAGGVLKLGAGALLIACCGFEDRALAIANQCQASPGARVLILNYIPVDGRNKHDKLLSVLEQGGFSASDSDDLSYNRYAPYGFATQLYDYIRQHHVEKLVLDISGMSKLAIMLCLSVAHRLTLDVSIAYAEATQYGPERAEYDSARQTNALSRPSLQIYTGVQGVVAVAELASVAMQGQPTAAIAFMSFNESLTQAVIDAVSPSRLLLINGRPPALVWREEATAWIHEQLLREWPETDNPVEGLPGGELRPARATSTFDYRETVSALDAMYWELAVDYRVVLAPTGSKLQTVACYLVKATHPDIHIEYPTPRGFLDLYSRGIGKIWHIRLGNLASLVECLRMDTWKRHVAVVERVKPTQ